MHLLMQRLRHSLHFEKALENGHVVPPRVMSMVITHIVIQT
jgi:hypothetical protein